jgi:hypothetical protein
MRWYWLNSNLTLVIGALLLAKIKASSCPIRPVIAGALGWREPTPGEFWRLAAVDTFDSEIYTSYQKFWFVRKIRERVRSIRTQSSRPRHRQAASFFVCQTNEAVGDKKEDHTQWPHPRLLKILQVNRLSPPAECLFLTALFSSRLQHPAIPIGFNLRYGMGLGQRSRSNLRVTERPTKPLNLIGRFSLQYTCRHTPHPRIRLGSLWMTSVAWLLSTPAYRTVS